MLGYKEMLRGIVAIEWVIQSEEKILSDKCNVVMVNMRAKFMIVGTIGATLHSSRKKVE